MTKKPQTDISKDIFILSIQAAFFILILPFVFLFIGDYIDTQYLLFTYPTWVKLPLTIICTPIGMVFLPWALFSLYKIKDRATKSNPVNPTFMIFGAYKLCRNPITLGALFYFVGLGSLLGSITTSVVGFLITLVFGNFYVFMIAEKNFEELFKSAYKNYKQNTPFLIPKIK